MNTVQQIYEAIQKKAPFQYQLGFDNAGFLVGRRNAPVDRVLIALDITRDVVDEAVELGAQLIVSHHPVIWEGVKQLTDVTPGGDLLLTMAEHGIAAICAHTNLDAVHGGVNDALAQRLGLTQIEQLKQDGVDASGRPYGIGRVGNTAGVPMYAPAFAAFVKESLGANGVRYVDARRPVRRVAVGGGACADEMFTALDAGCDTFVTADVKYDQFLEARALGITLMDAGHYATENVVCPKIVQYLSLKFPGIPVKISQTHQEAYGCV